MDLRKKAREASSAPGAGRGTGTVIGSLLGAGIPLAASFMGGGPAALGLMGPMGSLGGGVGGLIGEGIGTLSGQGTEDEMAPELERMSLQEARIKAREEALQQLAALSR